MDLRQDVLVGIRALHRSIGFSALVLAVLGLGIAANTLFFAIADAVVFRPFPFQAPERLVIAGENIIAPRSEITYRDFLTWREQARTFADVSAFGSSNWSWRLRTPAESVTVHYRAVSGNFFDVLGVGVLHGRTFRPDDDRQASDRTVVLSYGFWQRQFGGDRGVIGRTLVLSDTVFTVIGVMPASLSFTPGTDVWTPLVPELAAIAASIPNLPPDGGNVGVFYVLGRLAAGAGVDSARIELNRVIAQRARRNSDKHVESAVRPLVDDMLGSSRAGVLAIFAAVVVLLLVACANVAGLVLTRASRRSHEFAVRRALGASPGVLVRQLLSETFLLSLGATLIAVPLAAALLPATIAMLPADVPRIADSALNARALGFTAFAGILTALTSAIVPAARFGSRDLDATLRRTGQTVLRPGLRHPVRRVLIGGELAAAVALLTAAGLLGRSVWQLRHLDLGFEPRGLLAIEMGMPVEHMSDADRQMLLERALEQISLVRGVREVSGVSLRPLRGPIGVDSPYDLEGQAPEAARDNPYVNTETVTPSYFRTMRTRLLAGRAFDTDDRNRRQPVVIVSRNFAERTWPGQSPLGKRLHVVALDRQETDVRTMWTVVGVVDDIRYRSLDSRGLTVYSPAAQSPDRTNDLIARADVLDGALIARIRDIVRSINDNSTVRLDLMEDVLHAMEHPWRANLLLFGLFAFAATAIACLGLYGMVAQAVVAQQQEIGLRLVLGATSVRILREVLSASLPTVAAGVALGIACAAGVAPLMRSILFEVAPSDPIAFALAPCLFSAVALLASIVPAVRAAKTDPAVCLRAE